MFTLPKLQCRSYVLAYKILSMMGFSVVFFNVDLVLYITLMILMLLLTQEIAEPTEKYIDTLDTIKQSHGNMNNRNIQTGVQFKDEINCYEEGNRRELKKMTDSRDVIIDSLREDIDRLSNEVCKLQDNTNKAQESGSADMEFEEIIHNVQNSRTEKLEEKVRQLTVQFTAIPINNMLDKIDLLQIHIQQHHMENRLCKSDIQRICQDHEEFSDRINRLDTALDTLLASHKDLETTNICVNKLDLKTIHLEQTVHELQVSDYKISETVNNLEKIGNRTEFVVSNMKELNHQYTSLVESLQTRIEFLEKARAKLEKDVTNIIHVNQTITSFNKFQTKEIKKAHTLGAKLEEEIEAYHDKYSQLIKRTHQHQRNIQENSIKFKKLEPKLETMSQVFQKLQDEFVSSEHLLRTLSQFCNNEATKNNVRMARIREQTDSVRKYMRYIKKITNDNVDIGSTLAYAFTSKLEELVLEHKLLSNKVESLPGVQEAASSTEVH